MGKNSLTLCVNGTLLFFIFSTTVVVICGCALPQIEQLNDSIDGMRYKLYLVKYVYGEKSSDGKRAYSWEVPNEDYGCQTLRESADTAAAFGIMACILIPISFILQWVTVAEPAFKIPTLLFLFIGTAFCVISTTVVVHLYYGHFCGKPSFEELSFVFGAGFKCLAAAAGLSFVSFLMTAVVAGRDF